MGTAHGAAHPMERAVPLRCISACSRLHMRVPRSRTIPSATMRPRHSLMQPFVNVNVNNLLAISI